MKTIRQLAIIFVVLCLTAISFAASSGLPAKYDLDKQLEKVDSIYKYKFMSWERIDNQSLVVQTSPSDYYLIVLSSPSNRLPFTESISINSLNDTVKPGYNNVIVRGDGFKEEYIINKIYKFKDSKQVKEMEAQLTGAAK
jgi:hypothetical protein